MTSAERAVIAINREAVLSVYVQSHAFGDPPANEASRQRAVDRSNAVLLRGDEALRRISELAASTYGTPISAVSIISRDKQILLAREGIDGWETTRGESFCAVAIHRPGEAMVVEDALLDRRFRQYSVVRFAPFIRFYAGVPILDRGGYPLGALCVADTKPRSTPTPLTDLMMLGREAERIIAP